MNRHRNISLIIIALFVIALGFLFFTLRSDKQGVPLSTEKGEGEATFAWKFEKADTLNLDGIANTNVFAVATYENGVTEEKLIAVSPSSCNELTEKDADTLTGTTNVQCYGAGAGARYKITEGETTYLVQEKLFEEALPDQAPANNAYVTVAEFTR